MSATPLLDAVALALVRGVVPGPPAGDPYRQYIQIALLSGPKIVTKFWSRECPVDYGFTHLSHPKRLTAVGVGVWFPPVCNAEALIFCALPFAQAIGHTDFPRTIKPVCLGLLAAWASDHTQPGGAETWKYAPRPRWN